MQASTCGAQCIQNVQPYFHVALLFNFGLTMSAEDIRVELLVGIQQCIMGLR